MTKLELKALRRLIAASRSPAGRVPAEVRVEVISAVERADAMGMTRGAIAEALGIEEAALARWRWRTRASKLVAVRVSTPTPMTAPPAPTTLTVHGPAGVRVEGLSLDDVAGLLKRLA